MLSDGGYIDAETYSEGDNTVSCLVTMITYNGHELLEHIRDDCQWATVKKGLSAVRSYSLSAIQAIASGITEAAITAYLKQAEM